MAIVAVLAISVAVGSFACTASQHRGTQPPAAVATPMTPRQLRNSVSVAVVTRIDEAACVAGSGGVPGPGRDGDWCYFLDQGLDVTRAERIESVQDGFGGFAVEVTLTPADRGEFAAWTARAAGRQIAISVQGRIVAAPQLLEPLGGNWLDIPGLTEADAGTLMRQLR
ncbi:SecDF P1 head subdomain-containing protein [Asanoa iriomotensis]|uniref:SecDF P1 head subdomain-containing protein n=1 Tax=Asanoa iriomotensis TaxID=234613 RepID=UPI001944A662|nr:hypothetical protein [Asanoa iriomotensis]